MLALRSLVCWFVCILADAFIQREFQIKKHILQNVTILLVLFI